MRKPTHLFDRDWEWASLAAFATDPSPNATLGIVSGRRRQGKSLLLQELCAAAGGFYFAATEATPADLLRLLADDLGGYLGSSVPPALDSWVRAVDALLDLGLAGPVPVVLDEFPYLCRTSPELPSIIQRALGRRRSAPTRLILCGSALSFMGGLLSGTAPLRGRAGLDLTVQTFDFRTAAAFWGLADPRLALEVHSIVGGTPAYRREYVRNDAPADAADFDRWVERTVLDPACPLFKEARYLLAEEPDLRDTSLYHSVLAAVAEGNTTRGGIANYVGRKDDTLRHPLTVLEDAGLLARREDVFRRNRSTYRIAEPLLAFYHVVMRPEWGRLERPGRARPVWSEAKARFRSAVLGPHFEELCRTWARHFADSAFGDSVVRVDSGVVQDDRLRCSHELDVVVTGRSGKLLSIGEAKLGDVMSTTHLDRLVHVRDVLRRTHDDADDTTLACYSARGFTKGLRHAEERGEVVLVDLDRLYTQT